MKEGVGRYQWSKGKFEVGRVVVTAGVDRKIQEDLAFLWFVQTSIGRFLRCDWGDLTDDDREQNDQALKEGERLMGVYKKDDVEIWIITEWDRSVTTILFPDEY